VPREGECWRDPCWLRAQCETEAGPLGMQVVRLLARERGPGGRRRYRRVVMCARCCRDMPDRVWRRGWKMTHVGRAEG
jgi:hypothetical protein